VKVKSSVIRDVRESLAKIFDKAGIREVDANVLAELLIRDRDMDVQEIAENLGYSLSGVTGSLHRLMRLHLIVRKKEGKRYLYRSESNVLSVFLRLLEDIYNHDLPRVMRLVKEKVGDLKGEEERIVRELDKKLEKAAEYLGTLIELLEDYSEVV